ncbi:O-succinylbenzoate synthase [Fodinibius roseus]|uniref:o-succinylbenzoate synthase n=1 Tax=Fodinibius roseus TaxID=1194090 RepID=A0A1M4TJG9_9BACT|nr:o-succinylbenzoate synthase [Fodinibius roseus]SHE44639.1 O-succinylbenzoate synthase [Fodinibius roseus]
MKIDCYTYQLPFKNPFESSNNVYARREGIVFAVSGPGGPCYGEAAPLPGFSSETLEDIETQIETHIENWSGLLNSDHPVQELQDHYLAETTLPALQFALDGLAYQVAAQQAQQSLISFLFEEPAPAVAVNGLLSLAGSDDPVLTAQKLHARGFRTIKCKVGTDWPCEQKLLRRIRDRLPGLHIRLDANRAWTTEEAITNLNSIEPVGIEYCEEPLSHPTPEKWGELDRLTNVPLALDESINKNEQWKHLLSYCSFLIIKPMVIGSFSRLFAIRQRARQFNCSLVFTSSLESSIGRTITAVLASGLGSEDHAHGLNTGSLLAQDFTAHQPEVISGVIYSNKLDPAAVDKQHLNQIGTRRIGS